MKFVSFNIQYGVGLDGVCDPVRIADALKDADVAALQEVTRNLPANDHIDLPAILTDLMPRHYHAFAAGAETDAGSGIVDGRVVMRRMQFGNMILSRYPILAVRNLLLPRSRTFGKINLQRSALEALIDTPLGPIRVYSVHLDHRDPGERIAQIAFLKDRATRYGIEGGAVSGASEIGFDEVPHTDDFVIMGDFNMLPESPEYVAMVGPKDVYYGRTPRTTDPTDAHAFLDRMPPGAFTWQEPAKPEVKQYLDYCFVSGTLTGRLKDAGCDAACVASDHKPVWVEIA
jgi:endonuclease/exonuclease/phosphatase family metal-dependent hydrolase